MILELLAIGWLIWTVWPNRTERRHRWWKEKDRA